MMCRVVGHDTVGTYVIEEREGFYDVDEARYCTRCGEVNPPEVANRVARYISSLL
jgi:hypothetical protein